MLCRCLLFCITFSIFAPFKTIQTAIQTVIDANIDLLEPVIRDGKAHDISLYTDLNRQSLEVPAKVLISNLPKVENEHDIQILFSYIDEFIKEYYGTCEYDASLLNSAQIESLQQYQRLLQLLNNQIKNNSEIDIFTRNRASQALQSSIFKFFNLSEVQNHTNALLEKLLPPLQDSLLQDELLQHSDQYDDISVSKKANLQKFNFNTLEDLQEFFKLCSTLDPTESILYPSREELLDTLTALRSRGVVNQINATSINLWHAIHFLQSQLPDSQLPELKLSAGQLSTEQSLPPRLNEPNVSTIASFANRNNIGNNNTANKISIHQLPESYQQSDFNQVKQALKLLNPSPIQQFSRSILAIITQFNFDKYIKYCKEIDKISSTDDIQKWLVLLYEKMCQENPHEIEMYIFNTVNMNQRKFLQSSISNFLTSNKSLKTDPFYMRIKSRNTRYNTLSLLNGLTLLDIVNALSTDQTIDEIFKESHNIQQALIEEERNFQNCVSNKGMKIADKMRSSFRQNNLS